jgi:hypothetical protein
MSQVVLKPIVRSVMKFRIKGTSPLITHQWDEKAKRAMREKQAGKKTKTREVRNPDQEAAAAIYRTASGDYGVPGLALKAAIINAAHKDLGVEKTLVRKALFLRTDDPNKVIPLIAGEPSIREDMVRVGMSQTDMRYRPQWDEWSIDVEFEIDAELLKPEDVITLVNRAGFGVGICEWRPEKGGEFGRFTVDETHGIVVDEGSVMQEVGA